MRQEDKVAPEWVREFIAGWQSPTELDLKTRREALTRALSIRKDLKIAPLTTGELVSALRNQPSNQA